MLALYDEFVSGDRSASEDRWTTRSCAECAIRLDVVALTRSQARLIVVDEALGVDRCCLARGVAVRGNADEVLSGEVGGCGGVDYSRASV